jgi:hypothetical protein
MSIVRNFKGLPMAELISAPLVAASDSQKHLADSTLDFINKMFEDGQAKTVSFKHKTASGKEISVEAPLISIVNVPSVCIDNVNIDFNMEVRDSYEKKQESSRSVTTKASYKSFFGPSVSMNATLSSKSSSERKSDSSAKYSVSVSASNHGPPEGLSRLLDIFESTIPKPSDMEALAEGASPISEADEVKE